MKSKSKVEEMLGGRVVFLMLAALLLASVCLCAGTDTYTLDQVDTAAFEELVDTNANVLVVFSYTEDYGCQECRVAEAEVAALAEEASETGMECAFAVVDCAEEAALCRDQGFQSVPAILLFSEGLIVYPYEEDFVVRSVLRDFVTKRIVPKTAELRTVEDIDTFIHGRALSIIGFFTDEGPVYGSFRRTAAHQVLRYDFGAVLVDEEMMSSLLEHYDLLPGAIVMFQRIGDEVVATPYDGQISRKRLVNWVERTAPWLVYSVNDEKFSEFSSRTLSIFTVYFDDLETDASREAIREMELVSNDFRGSILFSYMDASEADTNQFRRWGFSGEVFPIAMLYDSNQRTVFAYPEGESFGRLKDFCHAYRSGDLRPTIVKQKLPEAREEDSSVKTLVYDNFRQVVFDEEKDVVVFFYLPEDECPHCIKFLLEYEDAADELEEIPSLVMGKIDMALNVQAPGTRVRSFPMIKLFPMHGKHVELTYDGARTADDVEEWIRANLSVVTQTSEQHRLGFDSDVLL